MSESPLALSREADEGPLGIYVHVPFCAVRCEYCDFAIVTRQERRVPAYLDALLSEIDAFVAEDGRSRVDTIYFGGGTPSRLEATEIEAILDRLRDRFDVERDAEISLEANPEDTVSERIDGWIASGVNRVTVGVQSLDDRGLAALGRPGSRDESIAAIGRLRLRRELSLGIDLIFGWPGQSLTQFTLELEEAIGAGPDHISCYSLETTSRTVLVRRLERAGAGMSDPDLMAEMYESALALLGRAGYSRYEISNFARAGHVSRHNLRYWQDRPYVGFGPSAASYRRGRRWINPRRLGEYSRGSFERQTEPYDPDRRTGEALMFGMRTRWGADLQRIVSRHGEAGLLRRAAVLDRAVLRGLAERVGTRIRLSDAGCLIADEIFVDLL